MFRPTDRESPLHAGSDSALVTGAMRRTMKVCAGRTVILGTAQLMAPLSARDGFTGRLIFQPLADALDKRRLESLAPMDEPLRLRFDPSRCSGL